MTRLTDGEVEQAADLLSAAREGRVTMAGLPPQLTPEHTADVQRIINRVSDGDRPARPGLEDVHGVQAHEPSVLRADL